MLLVHQKFESKTTIWSKLESILYKKWTKLKPWTGLLKSNCDAMRCYEESDI